MCLLCFLLESETIFKGYVPWSLIKQYHMKYSDNWLPKPENSVTTEDYLVTSYFWTVVFIGLGLPFVIWDVSHIQVSMGVPEDSIITCCSLSSAYCHFNINQSTFILTCFHFICLEFSPLIKIKTSSCVSVLFSSKNHKKNQVRKHKEVSSPTFCLKKMWALKSDQASQSFIQLHLENLHRWRPCNLSVQPALVLDSSCKLQSQHPEKCRVFLNSHLPWNSYLLNCHQIPVPGCWCTNTYRNNSFSRRITNLLGLWHKVIHRA